MSLNSNLILFSNNLTVNSGNVVVPISQGGTGLTYFGLPSLATAPTSPSVGQIYFDTTLGYPRIYCSDAAWHGIALF